MKRFVSVLLALLFFAVPCLAEYDLSNMSESELEKLIDQAKAQLEALRFDSMIVEINHVHDGYIIVRKNDIHGDCKIILNYGDKSLQYDLNGNGPVVLPLQFGSGAYSIYLGKLVSADSEKEPGHRYEYFQIDNIWGEDGPASVKCYDIVDEGVVTAEIDDPYSCFLNPNCYVLYNEVSPWVGKAAELTAGIDNDLDKLNAILDYVNHNFIYDYIKSVGIIDHNILPDIESCWNDKMGISQDLSALTCSMLRSQGIPAMLVYGRIGKMPHHWVVAKINDRLIRYDPTASLKAVSFTPIDYIYYN